MPTLFSWYLGAHGPDFMAYGIVSGHPNMFEGRDIHTSVLVRMTEAERGILLETRSGSLYHLRPEELSRRAGSPEFPLPAPETLGLSQDFWPRCARARELADRREEAALSALNVSGVLRLRVAGSTVLSALWAGRSGLARRVQPTIHLGMFQNSFLIRDFWEDEAGVCRLDFRYCPDIYHIELYKVSENIRTILIVNEGVQDVTFGCGKDKLSCAAGTVTEIDAEPWRRRTS